VLWSLVAVACNSAASSSSKSDGAAGVGTSGGNSGGSAGGAGGIALGGAGGGGLQATGGGSASGDAAVTAWFTVEPTSFDIGAIDPGARQWAVLTITNTGPATSGEIWVELGPGLTSPYGGGRAPLNAGEQGTFSFEIAPTSEGAFSSFLALAANPGANPPLQIPVNAMVAPTGPFTVSPRRIYLGTVIYGSTYPVTLQVAARENLADLTVKPGELLTLDSSSTCTAVLAQGETCTWVLVFKVGRPGSVGATATITATGSSTKAVQVEISGATSTDW
jgi:hypothetical protein